MKSHHVITIPKKEEIPLTVLRVPLSGVTIEENNSAKSKARIISSMYLYNGYQAFSFLRVIFLTRLETIVVFVIDGLPILF